MEAQLVSASLPGRMRASLAGEWYQARPAQRFAFLVGGVLILAGLAHLVAWLVVGGAWLGPVSFRKPTTFGVSFGLTTITLSWVTGRLRISDRARWLLLGPLAVADATEVAWVAVQRWRGVASHSNFATRLDTALFVVGGAAIAVAMHAIQVLPVLAWLLSFAALAERRRVGLVWAATAGYGALVTVSVAQTAAGRAPFDLGLAAVALALAGATLLAAAFTAALLALRHPAAAPR